MDSRTAGWMRHTLIWLTPEGRGYAVGHIRKQRWENAETVGALGESEHMKTRILNPVVPGILCRQPEQQNGIWVCGFSDWLVKDGSRHRQLVEFCPENVEKACSPFELCGENKREALYRRYPKLRPVFSAAENCGMDLGLYGSTALEWVTDLPYRHENSDFDLCARQKAGGDAGQFGRMLARLEETQDICLDVELEVCGYGIKLKELTAPGRTAMGKGMYDVRLFEKGEVEHLILAGMNCDLS